MANIKLEINKLIFKICRYLYFLIGTKWASQLFERKEFKVKILRNKMQKEINSFAPTMFFAQNIIHRKKESVI